MCPLSILTNVVTARRRLQNLAAITQAEAKQDARSNFTADVNGHTDTKSWNSSTAREELESMSHKRFQTEAAVGAALAPRWDFTTPASLSWEELSLPILEQ